MATSSNITRDVSCESMAYGAPYGCEFVRCTFGLWEFDAQELTDHYAHDHGLTRDEIQHVFDDAYGIDAPEASNYHE